MNKRAIIMLTAISVLYLSSSSFAIHIGLGVKGGLSLGTLYGKGAEEADTFYNNKMKPAFTEYGFLSLDPTDHFGVQIEVGYADKGNNYTLKKNSKNTLDPDFKYLEVPILIKGMVPLGIFKPMIYAGPSLGFLLSAKTKYHYEGNAYYSSHDTTMTIPDSDRNGFDLGIALGGGTTVKCVSGAIVVDVRYTIGLISLYKLTQEDKDIGMKESDTKIKTGTLALMLGCQFGF